MLIKIQNKNFRVAYHKACSMYIHSHMQNITQTGTNMFPLHDTVEQRNKQTA